jgi:hypothetical protein
LGNPVSNDVNTILLKKTIDESILNFYNEEPENVKFEIPYKPVKQCSRVGSIYDSSSLSKNKLLNNIQSDTIISNQQEDNSFSYDITLMDFPSPKNRIIERFDTSAIWGSFFYIFIILLSFVRFSQLIAKEKENKLRKGLIPLGLSNFAYWLSWIVCICSFDVVYSFIMVFAGRLFGFPIFVDINWFLPFIVITFGFWSYRFLSIMITVLCDNYKSANKANFLVLVISIFLQSKLFLFITLSFL